MATKTELLFEYHQRLVISITDSIKNDSYKIADFDSPQIYQATQLARIKTLEAVMEYLKI